MYLDDLKTNIGDPMSDEGYQVLQDEIADQLSFGYVVDQMDLVTYISQLIVDKGQQMNTSNPKRYDELQRAWALLAFAAFTSYSSPDQSNLMQRRILFAIQRGFNPQEILDEYFYEYGSDDFIRDAFRVFAHDLEQNTETFGTMPIEVEGKRMLPQLKYWILDYAKYPTKVAKRGTVERLNYVNNSQNTKALTQNQRETLLAVLKFYDELLNPNIPQRTDDGSDVSYEYELPESYEDAQVVVAPVNTIQLPPSEAAHVASTTTRNPDQELIVTKLEDLRERTGVDTEK